MLKIASFLLLLCAASAVAAPSLFPQPLHLVRRIDDPLASKPITVDEYCYGNRIVTVSGDRVTIADYGEQQITEIDHAKGTFSVTRFDEIAKAQPERNEVAVKSALAKMTPLGFRGALDSYEVDGASAKIVVGIDRSITLSRDAVEALIGASYPNPRREEHEHLLRAAAEKTNSGMTTQDVAEPRFGLPSEQTFTYDTEAGAMTLHIAILRVDHDLPPQNALVIEPGATRIESHVTRLARELREADTLPQR